MRTYEEYQEILTLWEIHGNKKKIARLTGIPRATVRDCIKKFGSLKGLEEYRLDNVEINGESTLAHNLKKADDPQNLHKDYAYLLGMYLGDGCISRMKRVHRIRITLDFKYPQIIQSCCDSIQALLPNNKVSIVERCKIKNGEQYVSCVEVSCYYKYWQQVLPQDGDGKKHDREIKLEAWQQHIVDRYPLEFFRGLYHSDGSRSRNVVNGKNYPRYLFNNHSDDIRNLFVETTEKLNLRWTTANKRTIAISKREDVAWLDERIGAKG